MNLTHKEIFLIVRDIYELFGFKLTISLHLHVDCINYFTSDLLLNITM